MNRPVNRAEQARNRSLAHEPIFFLPTRLPPGVGQLLNRPVLPLRQAIASVIIAGASWSKMTARKQRPEHDHSLQAELILKLYGLRRETVMREARS